MYDAQPTSTRQTGFKIRGSVRSDVETIKSRPAKQGIGVEAENDALGTSSREKFVASWR